MRCRICGAEVPDGDPRCPDCGQPAAGPLRPAFEARAAEPSAPEALPPRTSAIAAGDVLGGRYEVDDELGSGLLARLYRAKDRRTGARVMLRAIHPALLATTDERRAALDALAPVIGVGGPHLCTLLDAVEHAERIVVVEPLMEAVPLARVVRHRRVRGDVFSPREVLPVVAQTAAALAALPDGRTHGALDPSQLLVHSEGLRLAGAFLATAMPADSLARATRNASVSALAYLAPEVRAGSRPTAAADRYAVAAIVCECLTGRTSLRSTDVEAQGSGPKLSHGTELVLARYLDPDPAGRPPTFAELIAELASTAGLGVPSLGDADEVEDDDDERDAGVEAPPVASTAGRTRPLGERSEATRRVAVEEVLAEIGEAAASDAGAVTPAVARTANPATAPTVEAPVDARSGSSVASSAADADSTAPRAAVTLDGPGTPGPEPSREPPRPRTSTGGKTVAREEPTQPGAVAAASERPLAPVASTAQAPRVKTRRPAGAAAEGTAEIELDQILDERPSPARGVAASLEPAPRAQALHASIPSLGAAPARKPSLPPLSAPLPAAGAPPGASTLTTSGSIPVELSEVDLGAPPAGSTEPPEGAEIDRAVPSLLSAARRHASRPQLRAISSPPEPARPAAGPVTPEKVVVPEGVTGIPRARPPSGEQTVVTGGEVLFDDSRRKRPRRPGDADPTATEIHDRDAAAGRETVYETPRRTGSRWFVWVSALLALVILAVGLVIYLQRRDYAERRREIEQQLHRDRARR